MSLGGSDLKHLAVGQRVRLTRDFVDEMIDELDRVKADEIPEEYIGDLERFRSDYVDSAQSLAGAEGVVDRADVDYGVEFDRQYVCLYWSTGPGTGFYNIDAIEIVDRCYLEPIGELTHDNTTGEDEA